jgi:hypothetical protein
VILVSTNQVQQAMSDVILASTNRGQRGMLSVILVSTNQVQQAMSDVILASTNRGQRGIEEVVAADAALASGRSDETPDPDDDQPAEADAVGEALQSRTPFLTVTVLQAPYLTERLPPLAQKAADQQG